MVVEFERVDRIGEVEPQILAEIQLARLGDQPLGQLRVDPPVAPLVGIGQRRAAHRIAKAHGIEFRRLRRQAGLDIAQTFPVGQLGERHGPIMLGAGQCPYPLVSAIPRDNPREGAPRQKIHELSEKRLANVHGRLLGYPRKVPDRVQIDTTQKRQKTTENQNAMGRQPSLSRTDVLDLFKCKDGFRSLRSSLAFGC